MTEKEKMIEGLPYFASDALLAEERIKIRRKLATYNQLDPGDIEEHSRILSEILGQTPGDSFIQPPFYCDYGYNIKVGKSFYANFNFTALDVAPITIGNHCLFGPGVGLYTAGHPMDAEQRRAGHEYGSPIVIGDDVWLGGQVVVVPGVTIGSGVVVGAGSVVTKDLPDHTFCAGNPCKVLRPITKEDKAFYFKNKPWPKE